MRREPAVDEASEDAVFFMSSDARNAFGSLCICE